MYSVHMHAHAQHMNFKSSYCARNSMVRKNAAKYIAWIRKTQTGGWQLCKIEFFKGTKARGCQGLPQVLPAPWQEDSL